MKTFQIITDSSCDLPQELADKLELLVLPLHFTIGGKSSSPKTFDAGVGIYAVTAVLSVTGMAWTAKKRGN